MPGIEVRGARREDRAAMLEITQHVWDGDDYVPFVWDAWLADSNGIVLVATVDGQVAGFQHVESRGDGDAWLEGIRVAEGARGKGVGEALVERGLAWARDMGCRTARLAVSGENGASNRLSEKAGFRVVGRFRNMHATSLEAGPRDPVRVAQPFDEEAVLDLLAAAARDYPATYTEGWTAYRLTRSRLRLLLATHGVLVTGGDPPDALAVATMPSGRLSLRLGLVAGAPAGVLALARRIRVEASRARLPRVRGTLEVSADLLAALEEAGFTCDDGDMLLREHRLS